MRKSTLKTKPVGKCGDLWHKVPSRYASTASSFLFKVPLRSSTGKIFAMHSLNIVGLTTKQSFKDIYMQMPRV